MTVKNLPSKVNIMTNTEAAARAERKIGATLSARISQLRQAHGMTLDALANRAGLSKGTVVGIEQGTANPSIAILCRLAAAFSLSVTDLLGETSIDVPDGAIERTKPSTLWKTSRGSHATLLASTSGRTMFELWSWTIMPGDEHRSDAHSRGTRELVSVWRGRLKVTVEAETSIVKSGTAVRLVTDRPHSYAVAGDEPVEFTMAVLEFGEAS